jgi:predicted nucleic acid-binding protein
MEFLIYLDVCCLNRPFDNQTQERIRLETDAILYILAKFQNGEWQLLGSEAFDDELGNTPQGIRKRQMLNWAALASNKVSITTEIEARTMEIAEMGFKIYDALHIACAEVGNADVLLTTDDRMLRLARRRADLLQVKVRNPLQWLDEVTK